MAANASCQSCYGKLSLPIRFAPCLLLWIAFGRNNAWAGAVGQQGRPKPRHVNVNPRFAMEAYTKHALVGRQRMLPM